MPIDHGVVERLHVRAALTRKNFLFSGSERGAQSAAVIYSVLGSCALCDVDPVKDLREVISILASGIVERTSPDAYPAVSGHGELAALGQILHHSSAEPLTEPQNPGGLPDAHARAAASHAPWVDRAFRAVRCRTLNRLEMRSSLCMTSCLA